MLETDLKLDIDLLESEELACSKSSHGLDHALFRYNVLFESDINTPTEPSGEKDGIAYLGGYSLYVNPLGVTTFLLKLEISSWKMRVLLRVRNV